MKTINIKTIRIDGGTQSRVEINNEIVTEYAQAIQTGAEFPAVIVFNDGVDNWLADGFHRFHAHNQAGKASIAVDMRQGTLRDAKLFSFGANGRHGQRPTNADKRKSVSEMLADSEWSQWPHRKIAEVCSVSREYVSRLSIDLESSCDRSQDKTRTVERNGKTYEQNTTNIGKSTPVVTAPAEAPVLAVVGQEEEYTPLDAAHDQIGDLQDALAVATMGDVTEEDKTQAATLIAELRARVKTLEATLKAVTISRDTYMNENAELRKQITRQRKEIDKATGKRTA